VSDENTRDGGKKPNPHLGTQGPNPKKPIVKNPSTPGIQPPNKPDGRDAPGAAEQR
jgi:hypothetical protein